jgi:hemoglobin-like flavoprotein
MAALDADLLRKSWNTIYTREPHLIRRFYDVFFKLHPELRPLFKGSRERQEHMLAKALVAIIDRVEDRPWLVEELEGLANRHRKLGVTAEMYRSFTDSLMVTLEEIAGDEWTPTVEATWSAALDDVVAIVRGTTPPHLPETKA